MAFSNISRGLIFANDGYEKISRGLIFANAKLPKNFFFEIQPKITKNSKFKIFARINFRESAIFKNFAWINFRERGPIREN